MCRLLQIRVIEARSEFAGAALARGDFAESERLYKHALQQAEVCEGYYSPLAGSVLLGLHDLYEAQGREEEASDTWQRIRVILISGWGLFERAKLR